MTCIVKKCTCENVFQDATYGTSLRLHNINSKKEELCTVCGPKAHWQQRLDLHAKMHNKTCG